MNVSSTPLNVNPTRCVKTKSARTIAVLKKGFTKMIRAFVKEIKHGLYFAAVSYTHLTLPTKLEV